MSDEKKKIKVSSTADLQLALTAGYEAGQIEFDASAAIAAAKAEGVAEGKAAGTPDAAAFQASAKLEERKRILEIQSLSRSGFEAEAKAAIEAGQEPGAFALALLKAANDRGITLDAIKKDSPPAAGHAKPGDDGKTKASWDATVAKFGGK